MQHIVLTDRERGKVGRGEGGKGRDGERGGREGERWGENGRGLGGIQWVSNDQSLQSLKNLSLWQFSVTIYPVYPHRF